VLLDRLRGLGYEEGRDLFLFHYDWRRSSFHNAVELRNFIGKQGLSARDLRLIGHSMGGYIAFIYAKEIDKGEHVRTVVTMGTPFGGSVKALAVLADGLQAFGYSDLFVVPSGDFSRVSRVVATFESVYELLPTYELCCYLHAAGQAESTYDPLTRAGWNSFEADLMGRIFPQPLDPLPANLPQDPSGLARYQQLKGKHERHAEQLAAYKERLDRGIERLIRLRQLIKEGLPATVQHFAVAGDQFPTLTRAVYGATQPLFEPAAKAGDGTVTRASAIAAAASDIIPSAAEHLMIFDDDKVWAALRNRLD
jgi:pimeloyl-ACP methyl ester carboxylesterase